MRNSKNLNIFIFCLSFWFLIFGFCNYSYATDKIIAIVNSDVITEKDLRDFVNFMRVQLSKEYGKEELENKIASIKTDLLDKLIEDKLILQEAKIIDYKIEIRPGASISIKPDESKVKARIGEMRKHYSTDAEFQDELSRQGLVQADLEQKIREQIIMYNIIEYQIWDKIMVKPDEVTDFYNKNIKDFVSAEEREVDCFSLDDRDLASAFSFDLKEGKKMEDLATRYPLNVNKIKARKGGELKKDIEEAVFKLGLQEVSLPVAVDNKYYVFRLTDIIPSRQLTLSEVQDKIHSFLFDFKMREKLNQWLQELKKKSYIKIIQD